MSRQQPESKTAKFKKATAKIARREITKTKYSVSSEKNLILQLVIAAVIAMGISFGYVNYLMY